jgi:tetratricopeptide (TPR) repeat protein
MNKAISTLFAGALMLALPAAAARAGSPKVITFTTSSPDARAAVAEYLLGVESHKFGAQLSPIAQRAVAADPNFAFGYYLLATSSQSPQQAKPNMDKALELAKSASEGERLYIEAVNHLRSQQLDKGLPMLADLARRYPDDRMVQMMYGQASLNAKRFDDARRAFERALKLDGSTPRVYTFLGNYWLLQGDYAKARGFYQKALAKRPADVAWFQPTFGLMYSHVYQGKFDEGIAVLKAFYDQYAQTAQAKAFPPVFICNATARLYLESGRPQQAIEYYDKGYALVPGSGLSDQDKLVWLGRLHHGKGRALSKLGRHQEAWAEAETIRKMIEEHGEAGKEFWPAYHYIAGYLKLEAGDVPGALEHLKQADQGDPFHLLLLARAYEKAADTANARATYRKIVESTDISLERALAYPEAKAKVGS